MLTRIACCHRPVRETNSAPSGIRVHSGGQTATTALAATRSASRNLNERAFHAVYPDGHVKNAAQYRRTCRTGFDIRENGSAM